MKEGNSTETAFSFSLSLVFGAKGLNSLGRKDLDTIFD